MATLLLALAVAPAQALPPDGTYLATGSTQNVYYAPTVTLLQNGKALIAGRIEAGSSQARAELYDPATGTWSETGTPTVVRENATATLLKSGKVLVAGGRIPSGNILGYSPLATTELYDPGTGTWTRTATMTSPRVYATATTLANGRVLIAGGTWGSFTDQGADYAELYDPVSGTMTQTGNYSGGHIGFASILLDDGKVLMTGQTLGECFVYDPVNNTWSSTGTTVYSHLGAPLVKLANGKVLIAGGPDDEWIGTSQTPPVNYSDVALRAAEIYDPATGVWSPLTSMISPSFGHSMVVLTDGRVLAAGGRESTSQVYAPSTSQVYDPGSNVWKKTSEFPNATNFPKGTVLLRTGDVLLVSGSGLSQLYRPNPSVTSKGSTMIVPLVAQTAFYTSEILVHNPYDDMTLPISVFYTGATGTSAAGGPKACTPLNVPPLGTMKFSLTAQCNLPSGSQFGYLTLAESAGIPSPFVAYSRAQAAGGNGFSVPAYPAGAIEIPELGHYVVGLNRQAAAPTYQSNCFVASRDAATDYQIRLRDAMGNPIGIPVTGSLQANQMVRYLDIFSAANAPTGDHSNVSATFSNGTSNAALIGFCTVQESTFFGADFRMAQPPKAWRYDPN